MNESELIEIRHKVFDKLWEKWTDEELHNPDWIILNEAINHAIEISREVEKQ